MVVEIGLMTDRAFEEQASGKLVMYANDRFGEVSFQENYHIVHYRDLYLDLTASVWV